MKSDGLGSVGNSWPRRGLSPTAWNSSVFLQQHHGTVAPGRALGAKSRPTLRREAYCLRGSSGERGASDRNGAMFPPSPSRGCPAASSFSCRPCAHTYLRPDPHSPGPPGLRSVMNRRRGRRHFSLEAIVNVIGADPPPDAGPAPPHRTRLPEPSGLRASAALAAHKPNHSARRVHWFRHAHGPISGTSLDKRTKQLPGISGEGSRPLDMPAGITYDRPRVLPPRSLDRARRSTSLDRHAGSTALHAAPEEVIPPTRCLARTRPTLSPKL